jgi:hypothetical protein
MRNRKTVNFQNQDFEYEIDEKNIVYIKEGTTFISIGQIKALKQTDNIELITIELIKSYLSIRPLK